MTSGWLRWLVTLLALTSCKAAERKYDERRAVERAAEHAAEERAAKEEAERPPAPKPSGPGLAAGKYRLREVRVEVFETNARGNPWDDPPNPAPDLGIEVRLDGKAVATCKRADVAVATCTFDDVELEVTGTSEIALVVIDRDTLVDDPIGTASVGDPSTWGVDIALPMAPKQRVRAASVVLARPPTWWSRYGTHAIAVLVGLALAIGVVMLVGRLRPKRAAAGADRRRCSACGARLANYAKCSDCGAEQVS